MTDSEDEVYFGPVTDKELKSKNFKYVLRKNVELYYPGCMKNRKSMDKANRSSTTSFDSGTYASESSSESLIKAMKVFNISEKASKLRKKTDNSQSPFNIDENQNQKLDHCHKIINDIVEDIISQSVISISIDEFCGNVKYQTPCENMGVAEGIKTEKFNEPKNNSLLETSGGDYLDDTLEEMRLFMKYGENYDLVLEKRKKNVKKDSQNISSARSDDLEEKESHIQHNNNAFINNDVFCQTSFVNEQQKNMKEHHVVYIPSIFSAKKKPKITKETVSPVPLGPPLPNVKPCFDPKSIVSPISFYCRIFPPPILSNQVARTEHYVQKQFESLTPSLRKVKFIASDVNVNENIYKNRHNCRKNQKNFTPKKNQNIQSNFSHTVPRNNTATPCPYRSLQKPRNNSNSKKRQIEGKMQKDSKQNVHKPLKENSVNLIHCKKSESLRNNKKAKLLPKPLIYSTPRDKKFSPKSDNTQNFDQQVKQFVQSPFKTPTLVASDNKNERPKLLLPPNGDSEKIHPIKLFGGNKMRPLIPDVGPPVFINRGHKKIKPRTYPTLVASKNGAETDKSIEVSLLEMAQPVAWQIVDSHKKCKK